MKARTIHLLLVVLMLGVVGCDHATKGAAEHQLRGEGPVEVVAGAVDLRYAQNHGVAFSSERFIPERWRAPLIYGGAFAALLLLAFAWLRRYHRPSLEHVAFALIAGGALGNLIDRALRGYVVDFVHIHGWPIFNVADVALCVGAGLLLVHAYRVRGEPPLDDDAAAAA